MIKIKKIQDHFVEALIPLYGIEEARAMWRALTREFTKPDLLEVKVAEILPALLTGRPFQYVLGEAWFYGLKLLVNESVLIPRPETEELVHRIVQTHPKTDAMRIVDIGTGSGCIALALKKAFPQADVYALDVSKDALAVAKRNAERLGLDLHFVLADILEWDVVVDRAWTFDIVVSNPPYITPAEKAMIEPHVLRHEPELALFVPEGAPLLFYQHIADFGQQHLAPEGRLYFEINRDYGGPVVDLLHKKNFNPVRLLRDMQGADRIVEATRIDDQHISK